TSFDIRSPVFYCAIVLDQRGGHFTGLFAQDLDRPVVDFGVIAWTCSNGRGCYSLRIASGGTKALSICASRQLQTRHGDINGAISDSRTHTAHQTIVVPRHRHCLVDRSALCKFDEEDLI